MSIIQTDESAYCRDAILRMLDGRPSALVEMARAEKVVDFAAARARLRPAPAQKPFVSSLTQALANIDAVREASRRTPTDG